MSSRYVAPLPRSEYARMKRIDKAIRRRKTLYHSDFLFADSFVFFADRKHAALAGQLRDKLPNAIFFYDLFTPEVIRDISMLTPSRKEAPQYSNLAAYVFAAVAKGTVYVVLEKEASLTSPVKDSSLGKIDFWRYFQAGILTDKNSKVDRIVRVNFEDFGLGGVVWEAGQKRLEVPYADFREKVHPGLARFAGYVGRVERPLCNVYHCWLDAVAPRAIELHQEVDE